MPHADDDGDGPNNAHELNLREFGFDPLTDTSPLLTQFQTNGFYLPAEVQLLVRA